MSLRAGVTSTVLVQMTNIVYGLLLPRLLILKYGSDVNGVVSGALQMVSFLAILEAGLSAASIRQLYRPLVNRDSAEVSNMMSSVRYYYLRVAGLFVLLAGLGGVAFALVLHAEMPALLVLGITWSIALGPAIDFALTSKFLVYFSAAGQITKYQIAQMSAMIGKISVAIVFAQLRLNVVWLLLLIALMPLAKWLILLKFFRKDPYSFPHHYQRVQIDQRGSVFGHQLLGAVIYSGPILVVLITLGAASASVFSVNSMIFGLSYGFLSMVVGQVFVPRLGRLLVSGRHADAVRLHARMSVLLAFGSFTVILSTMVLLPSFLGLYLDRADQSYYSRSTALLFGLWTLINLLKALQQAIVTAAGHFEGTLWISVVEVTVFIVVLLFGLRLLSLDGVVLALFVSCGVKYVLLKIYCYFRIARRSVSSTVAEVLSIVGFVGICAFGLPVVVAASVISWVLHAVVVVLASSMAALALYSVSAIINAIIPRLEPI